MDDHRFLVDHLDGTTRLYEADGTPQGLITPSLLDILDGLVRVSLRPEPAQVEHIRAERAKDEARERAAWEAYCASRYKSSARMEAAQ